MHSIKSRPPACKLARTRGQPQLCGMATIVELQSLSLYFFCCAGYGGSRQPGRLRSQGVKHTLYLTKLLPCSLLRATSDSDNI